MDAIELNTLRDRVLKADMCYNALEVFMKLRDSLEKDDATFSVGLKHGKPSFFF